MNETDFSYSMLVDTSMLNERRDATLPALLRVMENTLEEHLLDTGMDIPVILPKFGVFWVFLAITAELREPIRAGERLHAQTWNGSSSGLAFRRELQICRSDGLPALEASCFSGLVDTKTRRMVRDSALLAQFDLPHGRKLIEADSRMQPDLSQFTVAARRQVYPSWVDGLGHVNNTRYGDMIVDLLFADGKGPEGRLRRFELYFVSELHRGEEVILLRHDIPEGGTELAGLHGDSRSPAFYARVFYR